MSYDQTNRQSVFNWSLTLEFARGKGLSESATNIFIQGLREPTKPSQVFLSLHRIQTILSFECDVGVG